MKKDRTEKLKEFLYDLGYAIGSTVVTLLVLFVIYYLSILWIAVIVLSGGHIPL